MARVVIDPVVRLEGHLRVEVEVKNGKVTDAWSSGTLFRGMEACLKGRAPEDAFYVAQRICGVCPVPHGMASTMATEEALGIKIPNNARLIRNLIQGAQDLHSHILWFYHLSALDYVDITSALKADPKKALALAAAAGTSAADFAAVKDRVAKLVASGQLGLFASGYWGHPAYKLPPELNLIAVAHYLEALEMQAEASRIVAAMGGKMPHFMSCPPGGTTFVPTDEKMGNIWSRIQKVRNFVMNTLLPDTLAIAPFYLDAAGYGAGHKNYLAWGVYEDKSFDPKKRLFPRGAIFGGKLKVEDPTPGDVMEFVDHAWYAPESGKKNPSEGVTQPKFDSYSTDGKYTWVKAPRLKGRPMEVGTLARVLVAYAAGDKTTVKIVNSVLAKLGVAGKPEVLLSVLGRIGSKTIESVIIADAMVGWLNELVAGLKGGDAKVHEPYEIKDGEGVGLWEAPRGALAHWIKIEGGKIANYQVVSPSTWNFGGRDDKNVRGPVEEALIGTPVADNDRPLEVLRVVHGFDP